MSWVVPLCDYSRLWCSLISVVVKGLKNCCFGRTTVAGGALVVRLTLLVIARCSAIGRPV